VKPEQSEVNVQNAKGPLNGIRHKFERKHFKGLVCPDVYMTYFCYKESCALVKMYSLIMLTKPDDAMQGPKQNSLFKVKYVL